MTSNFVDFSKYTEIEENENKTKKNDVLISIPKVAPLPPKKPKYVYTNFNHFNMKLDMYTKKDLNIDDEELKKIFDIFITNNVSNIVGIIHILKKIKEIKYFKHAYRLLILYKYDNDPSYFLDKNVQKKIINMFVLVDKYRNKNNKNRLPYDYIIYKLLQILDLDKLKDWKMYFAGSDTMVSIMDMRWKDICKTIGWDFKPSISKL